jgi:hypothetical protein
MNPTGHGRRGARGQRGLVFYAFVLMTLFITLSLLGAKSYFESHRAQASQRTLQAARDAILAHLANPDMDATGRRIGQFGVLPDLAFTGQGAPYLQCAYRTWVPGAALASAEANGSAARCFGRVPWQALGLDLGAVDSVDEAGLIPWIVVSPNLVVTKNCMPNLTPAIVPVAVANPCPGAPGQRPFPWITVVDERGNVIVNNVAFALILPGPPTGAVTRSLTAAPTAWLNSLTVLPGCPAPCVPGTYSNSGYQQANGQPTVLVSSNLTSDGLQHLTWLADPRQFNNKVLWVTVDELFAHMERRARQVVNRTLTAYKTAKGYYPYAAALNSFGGTCTSGTRFGHLPVQLGSCGPGEALVAPYALPAWLTDAGWQQYFVYAVSPTCVAASHACAAPGLTLNGQNGINAILVGPGAPITAAPFAPSRAAPQVPLTLASLSSLASDYVDSVGNANAGATGVFASVTPSFTIPDDDRLDIVQ